MGEPEEADEWERICTFRPGRRQELYRMQDGGWQRVFDYRR